MESRLDQFWSTCGGQLAPLRCPKMQIHTQNWSKFNLIERQFHGDLKNCWSFHIDVKPPTKSAHFVKLLKWWDVRGPKARQTTVLERPTFFKQRSVRCIQYSPEPYQNNSHSPLPFFISCDSVKFQLFVWSYECGRLGPIHRLCPCFDKWTQVSNSTFAIDAYVAIINPYSKCNIQNSFS